MICPPKRFIVQSILAATLGAAAAWFPFLQASANSPSKTTHAPSTQEGALWHSAGDFAFLRNWIGKYPDFPDQDSGVYHQPSASQAFWTNNVLRTHLITQMGIAEFTKMISLDGPEDPISQVGPWVTWDKCEAHNCDNNHYVLFINIKKKTTEVCHILIDPGFGPTGTKSVEWSWFGSTEPSIPSFKLNTQSSVDISSNEFKRICDAALIDPTTSQVQLHFKVREFITFVKADWTAESGSTDNSWLLLDRNGSCVLANYPDSPASLVKLDETNGTEDDVSVLERNSDGKSMVVKISKPNGNGLEDQTLFFRGFKACSEHRKANEQRLEDLR